MNSGESLQEFHDRYREACLYLEQGLTDGAAELLDDILRELDGVVLPPHEGGELKSRIRSELQKIRGEAPTPEKETAPASDTLHVPEASADSNHFDYGAVLMDSQFWEDAVEEFKRSAAAGCKVMESWERCGDCAARLHQWDDAVRYYQIVYSDPNVSEEARRRILLKITQCTQSRQKNRMASIAARSETGSDGGESAALMTPAVESEYVAASVVSFDQLAVGRLVGRTLESLPNNKGEYCAGSARTYRLLHLLHMGNSSAVVELAREGTEERFAGQMLMPPFDRCLTPERLVKWVKSQTMLQSAHLVTVYDAARIDGYMCIVREHLPLSLSDVLTRSGPMPISLAVYLAYQILDGLGDLHLHMGRDEQIRNMFHLDLRPSRVLLSPDKMAVKLYNGGLWKVLEESGAGEIAVTRLPLVFLTYRAPEQFRKYLARKRPPVFTDIYLFGILFYEMLTGSTPFRASSYEEYEIQHCEQYPSPPKVWRPEIPDILNTMIMKCLETDPVKRWRSPTQLLLEMEKSFSQYIDIDRSRDDAFAVWLRREQGN